MPSVNLATFVERNQMSRQTDSNRRPADYKSAALPTELCRQKKCHSGSERGKVAQTLNSNNRTNSGRARLFDENRAEQLVRRRKIRSSGHNAGSSFRLLNQPGVGRKIVAQIRQTPLRE